MRRGRLRGAARVDGVALASAGGRRLGGSAGARLRVVGAALLLLAACRGDGEGEPSAGDDSDGVGWGEQAYGVGPWAGEDPDGEGPARLDLASGTIVTYLLGWSWEGADREEDAWVFVNDLGYTIGLESVYISTSLLALVPCEEDSGEEASEDGELQALGLLTGALAEVVAEAPYRGTGRLGELLIGAAHAGHSSGADPSAVVDVLVEIGHLDTGSLRVFGAGLAGGDPYCGLHLLGAPVDAVAADGEEFDNRSALFVGWWSRPGEGERHGLEASVNLQGGSVRPFAGVGDWPPLPELSGALGTVSMTVVRYPARSFDGVDLAALSDAEIAYEALAGVMRSADVIVAESSAGQ